MKLMHVSYTLTLPAEVTAAQAEEWLLHRLAQGRYLATYHDHRLHLREIEPDAYVMPDHAWPNVIRHEPMTTELLLDLLDAVAAKLNRRAS